MDTLKPTPRNTILGFLADIAKESYSPQRTQQMQGVARFMGAPDIASTLDRLSYGESLTSGRGMTTKLKPETEGALTSLLDYIPASKPALAGAGLAGMFIGKGAKTWDAIAASKAQELARKGADARQIWKETGTFKGPDGHWRQEIDDSAARFANDAVKELRGKVGKAQGKIFPHEQLAAAYPESAQIWTAKELGEGGGSYAGGQMGKSDMISLGLPKRGAPDIEELRGTNLHELQHAIQQREGWARGGNPDDAELMPYVRKFYADNIDKFDGESHQLVSMAKQRAYNNLAGEAEARATQARMNLNAQQRRDLFPLDSYDVPVDQLIVRGGLLDGPAMAIDPKAQKKLVQGLVGSGNTDRYRLGDVKPKQAEALDYANGVSSRGLLDVFMAPSPEDHIKTRRIIQQKMNPENVGTYAKQAMQPNSDVLPPVSRENYATLASKPSIDPKTGEVYRAMMPLRTVDDGFEVVTIMPKGKRGKK